MSTLTVSAPVVAPLRTRRRATVTSLPSDRRGPWHAPSSTMPNPSVGARRTQSAVGHGALRLTRRGRLVILLLLVSIGAVLSLAVTSSGAASSTAQQVPVQYVTVAPGDTLWSIAGEVAPSTDRRDTVAEIVELNALDGSTVQAGQRIAVPVGQ
jgi:LysM repeat protein